MNINIKAFGIAKDILGQTSLQVEISDEYTVKELLSDLKKRYPAFGELNSLAIAVNAQYAEAEQVIKAGDEVVIIPPVAGG